VEINTIVLWVVVILAVSVVVSGAWSAFMAAGREGSGGPARGSLDREDDTDNWD
jgi:hypothetical protein